MTWRAAQSCLAGRMQPVGRRLESPGVQISCRSVQWSNQLGMIISPVHPTPAAKPRKVVEDYQMIYFFSVKIKWDVDKDLTLTYTMCSLPLHIDDF